MTQKRRSHPKEWIEESLPLKPSVVPPLSGAARPGSRHRDKCVFFRARNRSTPLGGAVLGSFSARSTHYGERYHA